MLLEVERNPWYFRQRRSSAGPQESASDWHVGLHWARGFLTTSSVTQERQLHGERDRSNDDAPRTLLLEAERELAFSRLAVENEVLLLKHLLLLGLGKAAEGDGLGM